MVGSGQILIEYSPSTRVARDRVIPDRVLQSGVSGPREGGGGGGKGGFCAMLLRTSLGSVVDPISFEGGIAASCEMRYVERVCSSERERQTDRHGRRENLPQPVES